MRTHITHSGRGSEEEADRRRERAKRDGLKSRCASMRGGRRERVPQLFLPHPSLSLSTPVEHGDVVQIRHLRLRLPRLDQPPDVAVDPGGGRVLHGGGGERRPIPQLLRGGTQSSPLSEGNNGCNFAPLAAPSVPGQCFSKCGPRTTVGPQATPGGPSGDA